MPRELFIHGGYAASEAGGAYEVSNPATGQPVAEVTEADAADIDRAVNSAREAFAASGWSTISNPARGEFLFATSEALLARREELARAESLCSGKPISDCLGEVAYAAEMFRYYAGAASQPAGSTLPVNNSGLDFTLREPYGVCALIVPWNAPLVTAVQKVAPALAAGNTAVLKPAPATSLTALLLAEIVAGTGVPPGVLNFVTGSTRDLGRDLVRDPRIDTISFTGSTATALDIRRNTADRIVATTLELGGKSPNVIFADADLASAATAAATAVYWNAGQDCCARSRVLVERSAFDEFVSLIAARAAALRVEDPWIRKPRSAASFPARSGRRRCPTGLEPAPLCATFTSTPSVKRPSRKRAPFGGFTRAQARPHVGGCTAIGVRCRCSRCAPEPGPGHGA